MLVRIIPGDCPGFLLPKFDNQGGYLRKWAAVLNKAGVWLESPKAQKEPFAALANSFKQVRRRHCANPLSFDLFYLGACVAAGG